MNRLLVFAAVAMLIAGGPLVGCASSAGSATTSEGAQLVSSLCGQCHPLARVNNVHKDRNGWTATVTRMRSNGLKVTDQQANAIIDYLTKRVGGL